MSIATARIVLHDNAQTLLASAGLIKKLVVLHKTTNDTSIFVGPTGVSSDNGLRVTDVEYLPLTLDVGDSLYGICYPSAGDETVEVFTSSVLL